MKPTSDTQRIPIESEELNEIELQSPEESVEDILAPEATSGTAEITAWDESSDADGRRVPIMPMENEDTITEQMVNTGNEEADSEQREAAEELEEENL
ncbi:hypothetical protein BH11VER1_BH11VER1_37610 [soil metagenome]